MRRAFVALAPLCALVLSGCASSSGSLALRVTDAADAIADFSSLTVTVDKITLTKSDGGAKDYAPASPTFDLTKVANANTTTLFSGAVDNGNYTKLTLHVSSANGVLASGGKTVSVKAPSDQLFLTSPFDVSTGKTTDFLFDVQVHQLGNGDYQLQPNAGHSGPGLSS